MHNKLMQLTQHTQDILVISANIIDMGHVIATEGAQIFLCLTLIPFLHYPCPTYVLFPGFSAEV